MVYYSNYWINIAIIFFVSNNKKKKIIMTLYSFGVVVGDTAADLNL